MNMEIVFQCNKCSDRSKVGGLQEVNKEGAETQAAEWLK